MLTKLNPKKALIWRILHRDNIPWVLDNGLHCANSAVKAPAWTDIGNPELISKRAERPVPIDPRGFLGDYIPFYFTPLSPMMMNVLTGRGGVSKRKHEEIIILASSLPKINSMGTHFVFTDSHAYYMWANFYNDLNDLHNIDWQIIQNRNFNRDADDPVKFERYQAEALIHRHLPVEGLLGMVCYNDDVKADLEHEVQKRKLSLSVHVRTGLYF